MIPLNGCGGRNLLLLYFFCYCFEVFCIAVSPVIVVIVNKLGGNMIKLALL